MIAFLMINVVIFAQQVGTNSPYSRYGYGLLLNPALGASEAMGGISYGLRRSQQANPGNPASYSEIDSLTFIFDMGVSGHLAHMDDGTSKRDFYNGNLDYVTMQFPLFREVGVSIGLLPYSKTGYNYGGVRSLSNIQYLESYRGTGGLSQVYAGAAWELANNFSAGFNLSYLFGTFSHSSVVMPVTSSALVTEEKNKFRLLNIKYDFGLQYRHELDKGRSVTGELFILLPFTRMQMSITRYCYMAVIHMKTPGSRLQVRLPTIRSKEPVFSCHTLSVWGSPTAPVVC